ncbi:hypothetical protein CBM2587_B90322 [Cupriavidus taiwanensis]|uniref:Uncharacterized protein n=1 Tax=Cupriavidus taiwanensis TaxID=164546 RepID=A0A375CCQ9_9BURK|nr:hypothetical protein CBM2587_B90322 [Cupriavidus taiwanensis]
MRGAHAWQDIARQPQHLASSAFFPVFALHFSNKYPRDLINLPALFRLRAPQARNSAARASPTRAARPFR